MSIETSVRDSISIVKPSGDLDAIGYAALVEFLEEHIGPEQMELILDLSEVRYINSICVGYIVQYWREVVRGGGFFGIAHPRPEVRRLLEVGGVHRYINLYDDLVSAVAGCQAGESTKSVLDERGLLELVKNFSRISLGRLLKVEIAVSEVSEPPPCWNLVRLTGDVQGVIAVAIDEASADRLAGRLLAEVPDCEEKDAAVEHLQRVAIDSSLSGLEEVGYEFEIGPFEVGVEIELPHAVVFESDLGSVVLGIDLKKIQTKRLRVQRRAGGPPPES